MDTQASTENIYLGVKAKENEVHMHRKVEYC